MIRDSQAYSSRNARQATAVRPRSLASIYLLGILVPIEVVDMPNKQTFVVERVQTGVRIEKRILKVLKALAEYHDFTLGDLLEGIVLHAFDGKAPFGPDSLARIRELKKIYGLDLDSRASHQLTESKHPQIHGRPPAGR